MDIVILFPGQGSQKPGMGKDLADALPAAREALETVDEALGEPLSRLMFEGPADALTLTHNAQPALLAHGAAVWAAVRDAIASRVRAAAGHSLGEFTAYHAAESLSLADAARLVRRRGELMLASGEAQPGTMAAILCDPSFDVEAICEEASRDGGVVVAANFNAPGQVVISGEIEAVRRAMELAKTRGAKRAIPLSVSGAFHSPLMRSAADGLRTALDDVPLGEPRVPVVANVTAEPVTDSLTARRLLLEQLTAPVRWTRVMERLAADHPHALFVEMGPGSVLTGLARKIVPDIRTATCGTVAEVDQLLAMVA